MNSRFVRLVMKLVKPVKISALIVFLARIIFSSLRIINVFYVIPLAKLALEIIVIIVCPAKLENIYKITHVWNVRMNVNHVQMKLLVIFVKMDII